MKLYCAVFFLLSAIQLSASKVENIEVFSISMKKKVPCIVVLPDSYQNSKKRFPVVYLLHGHGGDQAQWLHDAPQLKNKADQLQQIYVCPDGGYNSWYFDSPVDPTSKYETFIARELVTFIDVKYKTLAAKSKRAITGLSMGGHGALYISIRNKKVFGLAGSVCGGVDIRPFVNNWQLVQKLGDTVCCKHNWEENTVIHLADQLKNAELKLIIHCGLSDFFLTVNRALHQKLLSKRIEHSYIESSGGHNASYWGTVINTQLDFFQSGFR
jgi:S-formylglutathione hydrolase FrmB